MIHMRTRPVCMDSAGEQIIARWIQGVRIAPMFTCSLSDAVLNRPVGLTHLGPKI